MSNKSAHPDRDFSRFDSMSTEELREILYQDSILPEDQESDMDAILYIMEVVAKREAAERPESVPSTEEAWKNFKELYRSEDCNGSSLYEDPEDESASVMTAVPASSDERLKPRKNTRHFLRIAWIAAALIVLLVGGSLVAQASWGDIWTSVAQWTKDVFGFTIYSIESTPESVYSGDNDPRDALQRYGITIELVPTWLPDGYSYREIDIRETPTRKVFYLRYEGGTDRIGMTIAVQSDFPLRTYEKNDPNATRYLSHDIEHFIMQNNGETTIVWNVGNYECSIRGPISVEDAQAIIDSIYRS